MTTSTTKFKSALREAASKEFAHIPSDENSIEFTFSKRFNKQMDKLIRSQRKAYYVLLNTAYKRVAVILVICISMLTATFSVKAIREPIINFIKQIYSTFTHYSFEGDTVEKITQEYTISVPDGFEQTDKAVSNVVITTRYENSSKDIIVFTQMTTEYSGGYIVDNEQSETSTKIVNGTEVEFQKWYDTQTAIWTKDGYVFAIDCYGNIDYETIENMIISLS